MIEKKTEKKKPMPKLNLYNKRHGFGILLLGIVVALILGSLGNIPRWNVPGWETSWISWILFAGVIVGVLNIFHPEGVLFLILGLTLTFMLAILAGMAVFSSWAVMLFNAVIYLLAPACIIVGIKVLYTLATK